jgi:Resolvase, N terminal domain
MSDRPLIVYCRALTQQQKRSGLGLLAQQDSVRRYIDANPGRVLAELTEIESGRSKDRPQLKEALRLCRIYDARLIIARLDRLARSVAMIAGFWKAMSTLSRPICPWQTDSRFTFSRRSPSMRPASFPNGPAPPSPLQRRERESSATQIH